MERPTSVPASKKTARITYMGKIQILTREQKIILGAVKENRYLRTQFYFTGGTALSAFYLRHRYSDYLDLFTEKDLDPVEIQQILSNWSKKFHISYRLFGKERVIFCFLKFLDGAKLKLDFATYAFSQLEKTTRAFGIRVDSMFDIAVNKLSMLGNRLEVRDYVDLYFLLKKYTIWNLLRGVEVKFAYEPTPFTVASDFTLVNRFTDLPRMIKPLTFSKFQSFFREQSQKLGRYATR